MVGYYLTSPYPHKPIVLPIVLQGGTLKRELCEKVKPALKSVLIGWVLGRGCQQDVWSDVLSWDLQVSVTGLDTNKVFI